MDKPIILAICGKSCSGKDTLLNHFIDSFNVFDVKLNKIISDTTRPRRNNEKDLENYFFIRFEKFLWKRKHHKYLEWTRFNNWYYGTDKNQIKPDNINIGVFDIQGMRQLYLKKDTYDIVFIYVSDNLLKRLYRSIKREHRIKFEFFRRAYADYKDFINVKTLLSKFKYKIDLSNIRTTNNRAFYVYCYLKNIIENNVKI